MGMHGGWEYTVYAQGSVSLKRSTNNMLLKENTTGRRNLRRKRGCTQIGS